MLWKIKARILETWKKLSFAHSRNKPNKKESKDLEINAVRIPSHKNRKHCINQAASPLYPFWCNYLRYASWRLRGFCMILFVFRIGRLVCTTIILCGHRRVDLKQVRPKQPTHNFEPFVPKSVCTKLSIAQSKEKPNKWRQLVQLFEMLFCLYQLHN